MRRDLNIFRSICRSIPSLMIIGDHVISCGNSLNSAHNSSFTDRSNLGNLGVRVACPTTVVPSHKLQLCSAHLCLQAVGHNKLTSPHYGQVDGQVQQGDH